MDRTPFEEQPIKLADVKACYFQIRHEELLRDRLGYYASLSGSERKKLLEAEYLQVQKNTKNESQAKALAKALHQVKMEAERQAQEEARRQAYEKNEAERRAWWKAEAERLQPSAKEKEEREKRAKKEKEEREKRAKIEFDALNRQMDKATTREERVELGRKRKMLAPYTGIRYTYENHCWRCKEHISSAIHAQCPSCKFYICSCGACLCGY